MTESYAKRPRRRGVGIVVAVCVIVGVLVLAIVGVVIADPLIRANAEHDTRSRILQGMPQGTTGDVDVDFGDGFFLGQVASGRIDRVTVTSQDLVVQGVPVRGSVTATGVPIDSSQPVQHATFEVSVPASAVTSVAELPPGASLTLGDGTVTYADTATLFGAKVPYQATGTLALDGGRLVFDPQSVGVAGLPLGLDVKSLPVTYSVCVAERLPQGITVNGVTVTPAGATVTGSADGITLTDETLQTHGSC